MSGLCLYELEDNVWDEFTVSDDHIVPHPNRECGDQVQVVANQCKKSRHEAAIMDRNTYDAFKQGTQRNEETSLANLTKQDKMLEKDLSHTPGGVFNSSGESDPVKEAIIASDETPLLGQYLKSKNINPVGSEFCDDGPVLGEKHCAVDGNLFHYPLSHLSQTENDLSFFDNGCEDKESSDLLYYSWDNHISNFGDIDQMFSSCDATFGLESFSNEDDIWFSSSHSIEGSEDALKMDSKISSSEASVLNSLEEHQEVSGLSSGRLSVGDSDKQNLFMGDKISSRIVSAVDHPASGQSSSLNSSATKSCHWQRKQTRHHNQSAGKRRDRKLENGGSFYHSDSLKQFQETAKSSRDLSHQLVSSPGTQQVKQNGCDSEYETEGHSEIEGVKRGMQGEIISSNAQESSCMRSVLDDISLEATSFRQLQHVMEQLDIRTKLCIRDSLYRLARSAEQRHNCANTNGGKRDDKSTSDAFMAETNKTTGFMDVETDTNPIDRSIAHLLFHRPPDPSVMSTGDASSFKSHVMLHGSINGSHTLVKEQVRPNETAVGADESLLTSNDQQ